MNARIGLIMWFEFGVSCERKVAKRVSANRSIIIMIIIIII